MVDYLGQPHLRSAGASALLSIDRSVSDLIRYNVHSLRAFRNELLVYIGHCAMFVAIIAPVAVQLIHLLDDQIKALVCRASDNGVHRWRHNADILKR